ncbi:MAG TPA: hypothetical protein VN414_13535 [Methanosarcina sp.]|nr:hypothetical protein [Methanosarcina sp.]
MIFLISELKADIFGSDVFRERNNVSEFKQGQNCKEEGLKKQKLKQERTKIGKRDDNKTKVNHNKTEAYNNET